MMAERNALILRRPRSGRLEGRTMSGGDAVSSRPPVVNPLEWTHT